ncbi:replication protein A 70 kDa DNA-binding subunit A-like [Cryptomeria japonica]|uniref:replication protein A 70 kDa DNA-binding subunit A-like n=1 Tax=Cryptomeria japonica TaxID=3369 RepID=UPI0027DAB34C|nr:replication protein A 70 kDa DNA-binding subunit A-like [Cryptomeria japonica]
MIFSNDRSCSNGGGISSPALIDRIAYGGLADPLELTPYAIRSINAGDDIPPPLLQLLSFEKIIGDPNDNDRYKLVLSDGTYMQVAILPTKAIIVFTLDVKKIDYHLLGKPRYLFKEQEEQTLGRETPPPTKHALKFGADLPSPQNGPSENISPIKSLNPYQNNWTIKGCVTNKRKMHKYTTPKCNGQVFSFDIIDEEGCEIRITSFDEIAELHYHRIEQGASYVLSKVLKRCAPDAVGPDKKTRFTPIDELLTTTNNTLIDVIGVVVNVGEISVIHRKDGSVVNKIIVKINDMSTLTIDVNLWGPSSEKLGNDLKNMHTSGTFVILVVQNARVGYFNGKVINTSASTAFEINPSIPEAEPLRLRGPIQQSLDPHPSALHCKNNQYQRMSIASILQRLSVMPEAIETTIIAVLRFVKEDPFYYIACPLQFNRKECKKKCAKLAENLWSCPRCQTQFPECNYKYLLHMKLQDHTSIVWANAFDNVGTELFSLSAKELYMLQYDLTTEKTPHIILKKAMFKHYTFTTLVSTDTFNSERRIKVTIDKMQRLDFKAEYPCLLAEIAQMHAIT